MRLLSILPILAFIKAEESSGSSLSNSQVSIFRNGKYFGFGNLISDKWVLSTAHVVGECAKNDTYICTIKVGVVALSPEKSPVAQGPDGVKTYQITNTIINPNWESGKENHDIAIIELNRPVEFSALVSPICLSEPNLDPTEVDLKMSGWFDYRWEDGEVHLKDVVLQESDVIVKSVDDCDYLNDYFNFDENSLCVLSKPGNKGTCSGDSGAPLAYRDEQKKWRLLGLASMGLDCGKEEYHMNVQNYLVWIESNTGVGACM